MYDCIASGVARLANELNFINYTQAIDPIVRQTFASPSTVRWSSAINSTIELQLACTDVAHKARGNCQSSPISGASVGGGNGRRGAAFAHPRAADALFDPFVTQMYHILTQRA